MFSALVAVLSLSAAEAKLPAWFPMRGVQINSDQLEPEDFGSEDFMVGDSTITVKGHHWATSLYPAPDAAGPWDGAAIQQLGAHRRRGADEPQSSPGAARSHPRDPR